MTAEPLLDAELAAFMQSGISMHAASAAGLVPQVTRVAGCRVSKDLREVTLVVIGAHSLALLDDLRANGAIAAVFTWPQTHRTLQLKGTVTRIAAAEPGDIELACAQAGTFGEGIAKIGFRAGLGRILALGGRDDFVAVTFTPAAAFVQTPGPSAGTVLKGA